MCEFGVLSSVFDLLTFGLLIKWFRATPELFRTGWFVESLVTALVIILVVRTRRPFYRSRPGGALLVATLVLIPFAFGIPFLPCASVLGFVAPPLSLYSMIGVVVALYVSATEGLKRRFYRTGRITG
jgi:Mg2+-importing ATPase